MNFIMNSRLSRLIPYVPGEQPLKTKKGVIKLNTNENPYPAPPDLFDGIDVESLRKYPEPDGPLEVVAEHHRVEPKNVFIGNGSDEVLAFAMRALFTPSKRVKIANITYSFYDSIASLFGITLKKVPLKELKYDIKKFKDSYGGMILVNPNAPTGELLSIGEVHKLMEMNKNAPIIIDEAYIDFAGPGSALSIVNRFGNLLVTRSLSKGFSLAGIRAGYAIGSEDYINMMRRVKNTFNSYPISTATNAIMRKVLKRGADNPYSEYKIDNCEKVVATRERVAKALGAEGFFVFPSKANFLLIRHDDIAAKKIHSELRKKKILVRHFPDSEISDYIRVSIGTDEEMDVFLEEITSLRA